MVNVLVIRKPDKTVRVVELSNEAGLRAYSNRLPSHLRWTFEIMDEKEAAKLDFIDKNYVTAKDAQQIAKKLVDENEQLKAELAALKQQSVGGNGNATNSQASDDDKPGTAAEVIAKINDPDTTADEIIAIQATDLRSTVQAAAKKRLAAMEGK